MWMVQVCFMSKKTLYLFIDEGGNFDFSHGGSRHFILTCLIEERPFPSYDKLRTLRYDLLEDGTNIEYFHCSEDRQAVRNQVFSIVRDNLSHVDICSMIVQKNKVNPSLREESKFYTRIFRMLMKWVIEKHVHGKGYERVILFTDTMPVAKKRKAMEKGVKIELASILRAGVEYRIYHHQSKSNLNLQVVDYCNWAIYRKWSKGDERSYNVIAPSIDAEWDVFRDGKSEYY
jgi:hypothetical protein